MNMFDLLTETAKADTELLSSNDKLGDVFATAREVDLSFVTCERDRAEDFAQFVNGKQYGIANVIDLDAGQFRVLVLITMPITQHIICSVSGFMLCLSRIFQIDYQGWGSVVQGS
jgi:Regulator of ribonuclease activity B